MARVYRDLYDLMEVKSLFFIDAESPASPGHEDKISEPDACRAETEFHPVAVLDYF